MSSNHRNGWPGWRVDSWYLRYPAYMRVLNTGTAQVPKAVTTEWIKYLRDEYPVIAFKASTQVLTSTPTAPQELTDHGHENTPRLLGHSAGAVG